MVWECDMLRHLWGYILSCNETWRAGTSSIFVERSGKIIAESQVWTPDGKPNLLVWSISQNVRHSSQEYRPVADSDAHPSSWLEMDYKEHTIQYQVMTNSLVWFHSCHRGVSAVSRNWLHCCEIWKLKIAWSLRNWHELALKLKSSGASPTFGLNHTLLEGTRIESPSNRR